MVFILENWKTTREISELLKVSEETVRRWIRGGELTASLDGKSYVVKGEDLEKFIREKAKISGTSISKISKTMLKDVVNVIDPFAGSAGFLMAALNKVKKSGDPKGETLGQNRTGQSYELKDIEDCIQALHRKRKKTELEFQMKLLEIDDEIANYQKLKEQLENGGI